MRTFTLIIFLVTSIASIFLFDPLLGGGPNNQFQISNPQAGLLGLKMVGLQTISVENKGNVSVSTDQITVYVNSGVRSCLWKDNITIIEPRSEGTCTFSGSPCQSYGVLVVSSDQDVEEIYCT